jgi:HAD superfamily hydrolase (TIGR01484 family)
MRYLALASDYDGTLATHGCVHPETVAAIKRLRNSKRKLILVTGRELDELLRVFPEIHQKNGFETPCFYSNPASVVRFANLDSSFNSVALNVRIARIH